ARPKRSGRGVEAAVPEPHLVLVLVDDVNAVPIRASAHRGPMVDAVDGFVRKRVLRIAPRAQWVGGVALDEAGDDAGAVLVCRIVVPDQQELRSRGDQPSAGAAEGRGQGSLGRE